MAGGSEEVDDREFGIVEELDPRFSERCPEVGRVNLEHEVDKVVAARRGLEGVGAAAGAIALDNGNHNLIAVLRELA